MKNKYIRIPLSLDEIRKLICNPPEEDMKELFGECTCSNRDLFNFGCKCGYFLRNKFDKNMNIKVYEAGSMATSG